METSKLTAEGIIGEAVRIGAKMSGGEFPIEVFPIRIQRIISSLHDCQGYPVDYVAAAILAAIAVGIGNSHLVQVKRNWLESPILYMALIGRPGANKSHPLSFAFQPFIEHDYCQNQEYQKLYAEYERTMSMSKKERMEAGLDEFPQAPVRRRFLVSDITPEGLSLIHAQNPRGLCLWSDELSAWFKNFNRYNNGSEEQFWLSVFNAKPTISDRKSTQSSIFIRRPYISVIGTIQKKILGELVKGERSSNGFIDRILFVHVNFMRLRHHDKVKYFIYHALKREVPNARSWSELRLALRKYGIDTQWKLSRTTGEMQGVKFTCDQLTFSGSKIDRQFSFLNIDQELRYNALSATMNQRQAQAEIIREEPRHEYQQENHSSISLGLFTPSPTDYDTEEAIQANRLKKKKKKPKRKRGFSL